eukprot:1380272-Amorphochlora_amoeboformis.AAC.1
MLLEHWRKKNPDVNPDIDGYCHAPTVNDYWEQEKSERFLEIFGGEELGILGYFRGSFRKLRAFGEFQNFRISPSDLR